MIGVGSGRFRANATLYDARLSDRRGAWRGSFAGPGCTSWLCQVVCCRCLGRWEGRGALAPCRQPARARSRRCRALLRQQRRSASHTGCVVLQASLRTGARAAGPVLHRRRLQARRARVLHHHGPRGRRHQRVRPPRGHRRGGSRSPRTARVWRRPWSGATLPWPLPRTGGRHGVFWAGGARAAQGSERDLRQKRRPSLSVACDPAGHGATCEGGCKRHPER